MKNNRLKYYQKALKKIGMFIILIIFNQCQSKVETINIGYIGPLTTRATNLGIGPANAIELAVEQYNKTRLSNQPKVNLFIEDDQWDKEKGVAAYEKLRKEHQVKVLFISNTDGTIAISKKAIKDKVIVINPCNNDATLDGLNKNIFRIGKSTEEVHSIVAHRIIDLDLKKVIIMHYPNNYMSLAAITCKQVLDDNNIENKVVSFKKNKVDYVNELKQFKEKGYDAYVFFGYKEYGFAMKQARDFGITAKYFGSTVMLDPEYYDNSKGAISGTEFITFKPGNGNYILAQEFINAYESKYKKRVPYSLWPSTQAYDAANILLNEIKKYNTSNNKKDNFDYWLKNKLIRVHFFEGVSGNISIKPNGASRGIYFSLYEYTTKGKFTNIKE